MLTATVFTIPWKDDEFKVRVTFFGRHGNAIATHGMCVFPEKLAKEEAAKARRALDSLGIYEPVEAGVGT